MPLTMPEPRYFSIPSRVVGGAALRKASLTWSPCVRSLTQVPLAWTNSPAVIAAAAPTTVTRSRWPRALTRRTQKPVSALWYVTRSTSPASASRSAAGAWRSGGVASIGIVGPQAPARRDHRLAPVAHGRLRRTAVERAEGQRGRRDRHPDRHLRVQAGQQPVDRAVSLREAAGRA